MSSTYGKNLRLTVFGQSHAAACGMVLTGLPAGFRPDRRELARFLARRAPGRADYTTARKEKDEPVFVTGLTDGTTDGTPLTAIFLNEDCRSEDYAETAFRPRPGHADYTAAVKFNGHQDPRGGGHFSGRSTAPLCLAGGICRQLLAQGGITVAGRIGSIGTICDDGDFPAAVTDEAFPVVDAAAATAMQAAIAAAKERGDSIGGSVQCVVAPLTVTAELKSAVAAAVFAVPAVKALSFADGDGALKLTAVFKPTPSLALPQRSVDLHSGEEVTLRVGGRHDPCIVPRGLPAVEAAVAIAVYDALLGAGKAGM